MSDTLIIIDSKNDWAHYYPSENVVTFEEYLSNNQNNTLLSKDKTSRLRIINLCQSNSYLSEGYYCSLLAEARGHSVIPSVRTLNDLSLRSLYRIDLALTPSLLTNEKLPVGIGETVEILSFFGTNIDKRYSNLVRKLFEYFPCPILQINLVNDKNLKIEQIKIRNYKQLDDENETAFASALDHFSRKVWRKKRSQKQFRYDLAILVDPDEKFPPSDKPALKQFITAGKALGIDCELITQKDYLRLPEYDGLFIRATTAINHFTYRFAKKAETEGLAVIDDPNSILRCTNKIYLADLFHNNKVPTPKTELIYKFKSQQIEHLEKTLDYPMILKIPDGSFSVGVEKVNNRSELESVLASLFKKSTLLLAQEFLYTDFDWRIGILNNKAIYACRYYMVKDHWQIYLHDNQKTDSGNFETISVSDVPKSILDTALKSTKQIGNGFYGVDIKEKNGTGFIIEVNDNPSIDYGIEDKYLGNQLYHQIMSEFLRRMEIRTNPKNMTK